MFKEGNVWRIMGRRLYNSTPHCTNSPLIGCIINLNSIQFFLYSMFHHTNMRSWLPPKRCSEHPFWYSAVSFLPDVPCRWLWTPSDPTLGWRGVTQHPCGWLVCWSEPNIHVHPILSRLPPSCKDVSSGCRIRCINTPPPLPLLSPLPRHLYSMLLRLLEPNLITGSLDASIRPLLNPYFPSFPWISILLRILFLIL